MSNKLAIVINFLGNDKLSGSLKNIVNSGKTGTQVLKGMAREAAGLERELAKVRRELDGASGNITELARRESELERAIASANDAMASQSAMIQIEETEARWIEFSEKLKEAGTENVIEGGAIAAPLVLALKAAGDFSSGMVDIQQKVGLTNAETEQLAQNILFAARAAKQMPEDMRGAVDILSSFGVDPRDAAKMVPDIGRLMTAFKVEGQDASAAAFANLNNLKVSIAQTGAAFDIMASAGNKGAFEIKDMARHFPGLTAQMQAMGETGLDAVGNLSAALQIARTGTGDADEAANNVKNLLAKINAPGTIRAFEKNFGVNLPEAMKKLKAQGLDTFEAIAVVTEKATKGDMSKLAFAFEDMQAQGAIRSLIQNLKEYRRIRDESMDSGGTVSAAFDQRMFQDATVGWRAMRGEISALAITLGTTLLPVMVTTIGYINSIVGGVADWAKANPEAAATLMKIVAGLAVFKIALGAAQFALGAIIAPIARVWSFFSKVGVFFRTVHVMGLLRNAVFLFGRAFMWLGRIILLNPIGLLVTVLAVAGYMIWKHWDTIKGAFNAGISYLGQAWAWIKGNARTILEFSGPIGQAALFIWDHWGTIKKAFGDALTFIWNLHVRFVQVGSFIIDGLVAGIKAAPGKVWEALKWVVMKGISGIKNLLGIASPSRLFMQMGGFVSDGLALGIDRGGGRAVGSMKRLAAGVAAAGALSLSPAYGGSPRAAGAGGPETAGVAAASAAQITIHIHAAPGQSAREIAEEVRRELEKLNDAKRRGDFGDDD